MTDTLLRDSPNDGRFWYWRGASGNRYIHSVYPADSCPPLPGAVFVAVKRTATLRTALRVGRFSVHWDLASSGSISRELLALGANEIHVHLLAGSEDKAKAIFADLNAALMGTGEYFGLAASPVILAA